MASVNSILPLPEWAVAIVDDIAGSFTRSTEDSLQIANILGPNVTTRLPFVPNGLTVVAKRYLQTDKDGVPIESPEQMFYRVAHALAAVERNYGREDDFVSKCERAFFECMARFEFTPAGRTLANAGALTDVVANCIVLHIKDSMDGIFITLREAALLQKAGSGLGFPFHQLRPAGARTTRSGGESSGPISFLHVYNTAFGVIKQQNRHGANMGVMSVEHPDILEFIHCKEEEGAIKNFNISVGFTDRFMTAVVEKDPLPWKCVFDGEEYAPRRIVRDKNHAIVSITPCVMTAAELFEEIIQCAWKNGEPGCIFLDTVNKTNPLPGMGRIEACNPCGEQFLHDGDVCNLGSINLEKFSDTPQSRARLTEVTRLAVRMLDNVIDLTNYPVERVNNARLGNRRIGLGEMGLADYLLQERLPYNTKAGREAGEALMKCIQETAEQMSEKLAIEKGVFPNWPKSVFSTADVSIPRRNAALTTVAPTGTIAMMFNVSGGIEPYFALAYNYQNILGGDTKLMYVNKHLRAALESESVYSEAVMAKIIKKGTLQGIDEIPEWIRQTFVTSMDISADEHILMQAALQRQCDNAISKTINYPNSATEEDCALGFINAWQNKCKGCTAYRDGSRFLQVLNLNDSDPSDDKYACPDCAIALTHSEGCSNCMQCGFSACDRK